jgi:hypothetical protein
MQKSIDLADSFRLFRTLIPYKYYHAIHIAMEHADDPDAVVALLHDLVEDGDCTWEQIEDTVTEEQLEALNILAHDKNIAYQDYIRKCKKNPIARKVKLWDIDHHLDSKESLPRSLESRYYNAWYELSRS